MTITKEQIEKLLENCKFESVKMGTKTTVLLCTLPNGFEIAESSACVDPKNYLHELGMRVCRDRIINRIWQLEGYRLQTEVYNAMERT